ncbi:unnamed protein product [Moneuplotes crassus]|uniref:Uncharacterized protein n=1 Tax=Euplotes crassus TaxID=5936 RepID=A0AAD2CZ79_EUPCR|nr:unnamed protein product [Moneuplotes crassus]
MSSTDQGTSARECKICLEPVQSAYLLECADMYCWECIKHFCESQKKRKLTPSCPLCIHEIKGEWLTNLLEGDAPPPPPPPKPQHVEVRREEQPEDDLALPVLGGIHSEELKGETYFCPSCQEGEGVINNSRTKATCACGHVFCVECYQEWGANDAHRCIRQGNGENSGVLEGDYLDRIRNIGQNGDELLCPKCTMRCEIRNDSSLGKCEMCEHEFCMFCREDYDVGHRFSPFKACGKKYSNGKDDICLALTWYLFIDIIIYPQLYFLTPITKKLKCPKECGEYIGAIILLVVFVFLFLLAILFSCFCCLIFPCLALQRSNHLKRRLDE